MSRAMQKPYINRDTLTLSKIYIETIEVKDFPFKLFELIRIKGVIWFNHFVDDMLTACDTRDAYQNA